MRSEDDRQHILRAHFAVMTGGTPEMRHRSVQPDIQMPAPVAEAQHPVHPLPASREQRTAIRTCSTTAAPLAHIDDALEPQVLNVPQRQREADVYQCHRPNVSASIGRLPGMRAASDAHHSLTLFHRRCVEARPRNAFASEACTRPASGVAKLSNRRRPRFSFVRDADSNADLAPCFVRHPEHTRLGDMGMQQ